MSFNQLKLSELAVQTVSGSNLYSYVPANGDSLANVVTTGYFAKSQYLGEDGWVHGYIFCVLSDGSYIVQIDTTGITAVQFGAGGSQIPTILADIVTLQGQTAVDDLNLHNVALVDMGGNNYTLTDTEAQSGVLILSNEKAGGTILTWPTTSAGKIPNNQLIYTGNIGDPVTMVYDSKPRQDVLVPGYLHQVSIIDSGGAAGTYNLDDIVAQYTSTRINGTQVLAAGANSLLSLTGFGLGYLLAADNAAAQTLDIAALPAYLAAAYKDVTFLVSCEGAGGLTITVSGGAVLVGNAVFAAGQSGRVVKIGTTNTWRILR